MPDAGREKRVSVTSHCTALVLDTYLVPYYIGFMNDPIVSLQGHRAYLAGPVQPQVSIRYPRPGLTEVTPTRCCFDNRRLAQSAEQPAGGSERRSERTMEHSHQ